MSPVLIVALAILAFAAGFHLHWALGGRLGFSVSLPQRPDGAPVMAHRSGWWRPAAGGVALGLVLLGALALAVGGHLPLPLPAGAAKAVLILTGAAFILRAIVPAPYTGFFKRIRATRWARYDTRLYCPLFLLLGAALIAIASAIEKGDSHSDCPLPLGGAGLAGGLHQRPDFARERRGQLGDRDS